LIILKLFDILDKGYSFEKYFSRVYPESLVWQANDILLGKKFTHYYRTFLNQLKKNLKIALATRKTNNLSYHSIGQDKQYICKNYINILKIYHIKKTYLPNIIFILISLPNHSSML